MYKESFLMAWASLIANKLRSLLTMLGFLAIYRSLGEAIY